MIKYLMIFILVSCSGIKTPKNTHIKKIPAADQSQAEKVIQNQIDFLQTLFQQSKDPYYDVPKWPEFCLRENIIGPLKNENGVTYSSSALYMRNNEPGFCSNSLPVERKQLVYLYCPKEKTVLELIIPYESFPEIKIEQICQ